MAGGADKAEAKPAETSTAADQQKPDGEKADTDVAEATSAVAGLNMSVEHPLQTRWVLWYDRPNRSTNQRNWSTNLRKVFVVGSVEQFWSLFNSIRPASKLPPGSNYHFFKEGVEPKWEDPANEGGGKWICTTPKTRREQVDKLWLYTLLAMIGEHYTRPDLVTGAVMSARKQQDRIAVWTRMAKDGEMTLSLGQQFKKFIEIPERQRVNYQVHGDAMKRNSSFNNKHMYEC